MMLFHYERLDRTMQAPVAPGPQTGSKGLLKQRPFIHLIFRLAFFDFEAAIEQLEAF
jgi:hypothetical protein